MDHLHFFEILKNIFFVEYLMRPSLTQTVTPVAPWYVEFETTGLQL